jgi:CheY-like chemotaxis protein
MRPDHEPPARPHFLIVEDDEPARVAMRRLLEGTGFRCAEAADGREALEVARERPPRLALLDLLMPGPDGLEVARRRRADPRTQDVLLSCLTGWDEPAVRRRAQRAGCEAFLAKPLDPATVLDLVTIALQRGGGPGRAVVAPAAPLPAPPVGAPQQPAHAGRSPTRRRIRR